MYKRQEIHLGHKTITYKELVGSGKSKIDFVDIDLNKATEYAAEDADVTLRLYNTLKPRMLREKLDKVYNSFEKPLIKILSQMEINGIKVDKIHLKKLSEKFNIRLLKIEKKIYNIAKKEFGVDGRRRNVRYADKTLPKNRFRKRPRRPISSLGVHVTHVRT